MQTVNKYPVNIVSSNKIIIEWELLNKLRAGSLFFFCHEVQKCLHLHALIQQTTAKSHTSSHYNIYMYVHSEYNQSDLVIALPISSIHTSLWKQQSSLLLFLIPNCTHLQSNLHILLVSHSLLHKLLLHFPLPSLFPPHLHTWVHTFSPVCCWVAAASCATPSCISTILWR